MCNLTPQQIDAEVDYLLSQMPTESDMSGRVMLKNGEWEREEIIAYVESRLRWLADLYDERGMTSERTRELAFREIWHAANMIIVRGSIETTGFVIDGIMPDFISNIVLSACEPVKQADGSMVIVLRDPRAHAVAV